MDPVEISAASIVKLLASCNQPTRSRAVRLLCRWLPQQSSAVDTLSDGGDLIKIWKGLFYCVWHADKLPFQLDLINRLSSLLETLSPNLSILYFESFLVTIRREWSGIDFLRLDKFYLLIRKFTHRFFTLLKKNDWDIDLLNRLTGILRGKCLLAIDKFQAGGVNYHIAEVFLEEIDGFLTIKPEILDLLLMPFVLVLQRSSDRVLVNKVKVNVFERIVENGVKYLNGERSGEAEKLGKYALVLGFSEKFFKWASDEGTVQGNRKVLFGLHERFLKLEKDFEKSRLEISFEDLGNGNEGGKLVSLNGTETIDGDGGSEVSPPKKGKKEGAEKKNKAKKKKKKKNVLLESAADSNGKIDDDATTANGDKGIQSNGAETKSKSKKKKNKNLLDPGLEINGEVSDATVEEIQENANGDVMGNDDLLNFNGSVISNLQKQFEKVAAEAGMPLPATPVNIAATKKRKRAKSVDKQSTLSNGESVTGKSREKSVKRVRFSLKNNLVWKPQTPMPPQSLRLPPSTTPRGSALKKGVPPGPVKESPATVKKIKAKGSSVKKARKSMKSVSPAVKRLRKLQSLSM